MPSRDRVQLSYRDEVAPGNKIDLTGVIPAGEVWQVSYALFSDKNIGDNISGGFSFEWGAGGGWEIIHIGFLTGNIHRLDINRSFTGDGLSRFRTIRQNNSASNKDMIVVLEGFKKNGD